MITDQDTETSHPNSTTWYSAAKPDGGVGNRCVWRQYPRSNFTQPEHSCGCWFVFCTTLSYPTPMSYDPPKSTNCSDGEKIECCLCCHNHHFSSSPVSRSIPPATAHSKSSVMTPPPRASPVEWMGHVDHDNNVVYHWPESPADRVQLSCCTASRCGVLGEYITSTTPTEPVALSIDQNITIISLIITTNNNHNN